MSSLSLTAAVSLSTPLYDLFGHLLTPSTAAVAGLGYVDSRGQATTVRATDR